MEQRSPGKLRILFFSHYFPPEGNAPASRVHETCKRWADAGHDVMVVTCAPNIPDGRVYNGYQNAWTTREQVDGVHVVRIWTFLAANKGAVRRSLNYLSYLVSAALHVLPMRRPDIILATSPQFFCGWAGVVAKWWLRRPLVLEIRDLWPESVVEVGAMRRSLGVRALERLERAMYRSATHIVTVGEGYQRRLIERGVPSEKLSVIANGVDRDLFDAQRWLRPIPPRKGPFVVSYVGTIGMACGLRVVLRAAEKLKAAGRHDIHFQLVGDGAERESLQAEAASMGLENVVFTGRLTKSEIPGVLHGSDACLVHLRRSALFETVLPSKMFEAMAMKRPVILGVRGDAARVLREADGGVCVMPEDEDDLLAAIDCLMASPAQAARWGESGYDYVMRWHDRDHLASAYLALLERLRARLSGGAAESEVPCCIEPGHATPAPQSAAAEAGGGGDGRTGAAR